MSDYYKKSGVDLQKAASFVDIIKPLSHMTRRHGCLSDIGGFGSLFDIQSLGYQHPVLVSSTDGVGTKLKLAVDWEMYETIGQDLVAMCVNDTVVHGAQPLFFLDYFACGHLDICVAETIMKSISYACKTAGCALVGGETAEMPGLYRNNDIDLAGFCVGVVEKERILPRLDDIVCGDCLIGLMSSGVHANGFSFIRKLFDTDTLETFERSPHLTLRKREEWLCPTKIYVPTILNLLNSHLGSFIKALAHITGGGFFENIPRILPSHLAARINPNALPEQDVFTWIQQKSNMSIHDMCHIFNMGIGMVMVVSRNKSDCVLNYLCKLGEPALVIGDVCMRCHSESHDQPHTQSTDSQNNYNNSCGGVVLSNNT